VNIEKRYIHSGQLFVAVKETHIMTVLGSCVAVCLYDPINEIGGMNHYLLPLWNNKGLASPKYGNISIEKLIDTMETIGCERKNIIAKIFGGASPNNFKSNTKLVGEKNIEIAYQILNNYGIKVVAKDLGGIQGRKIAMNTKTGKIQMVYTKGIEE